MCRGNRCIRDLGGQRNGVHTLAAGNDKGEGGMVMDAIPPIDLPWPDRCLHPNARHHWAPKAKATRRARETGRMCAYASGIRKFDASELKVTITFFPPDNRRRDLDGMLSNMKAMLDGIADATGVDDCDWSIFMKRGEVRKHGAVRVEMEPI